MTNIPALAEEKLTVFTTDQAQRELTRLNQYDSQLAVLRDAVPNLLGRSLDEVDHQEPVGFGAAWNLKQGTWPLTPARAKVR